MRCENWQLVVLASFDDNNFEFPCALLSVILLLLPPIKLDCRIRHHHKYIAYLSDYSTCRDALSSCKTDSCINLLLFIFSTILVFASILHHLIGCQNCFLLYCQAIPKCKVCTVVFKRVNGTFRFHFGENPTLPREVGSEVGN